MALQRRPYCRFLMVLTSILLLLTLISVQLEHHPSGALKPTSMRFSRFQTHLINQLPTTSAAASDQRSLLGASTNPMPRSQSNHDDKDSKLGHIAYQDEEADLKGVIATEHPYEEENYSEPLASTQIDYEETQTDSMADDLELHVDPNGYLMYLPHSGFSNQISELENALIIAHILNRTLIVNPIYLGLREMSWAPYDRLMDYIRRMEEIFAKFPMVDGKPTPVLNYFNRFLNTPMNGKGMIAMHDIFDLSRFNGLVRTISVADFLSLGLVHSEQDVYAFKENIQYEYKYVDSIEDSDKRFLIDNVMMEVSSTEPTYPQEEQPFELVRYLEITTKFNPEDGEINVSTAIDEHLERGLGHEHVTDPVTGAQTMVRRLEMGKFHHVVNLAVPLPEPKKPLLILGSTFGYARVGCFLSENTALQERIRKSLVYSNSHLDHVVDRITKKMGGSGSYVGIHLRVGDGYFTEAAGDTIQNMVAELVRRLESGDQHDQLIRPLHVYLCTDAEQPNTNPLLEPLRKVVDRIWTLSDFHSDLGLLNKLEELKQPRPSIALSLILDRLRGIDVSDELDKFSAEPVIPVSTDDPVTPFAEAWLPFVDQMVASRGFAVLGTKASTFSGYMERLHSHYWRTHTLPDTKARKGGRFLGKV